MTPETQNLRLEVIERPAEIHATRATELIDAFAELSYKTTGGKDWQSYRPAIDGWRQYYGAVGARPQDYDRLLLIYAGDTLAHFTGLTSFVIEPERRFIFIRTAMTLGQYHGAGLLKQAILTLFSPAWLKELGDVYFILRTANPIVYEATRALTGGYLSGFDLTLCPQINEAGQLDPPPPELRQLAIDAARAISPGCGFDPETFVTKAYFKAYGALYREPVFPCRNPATQEYFQRVVDYDNQDGLVILIHSRPRTAV
jgi:hypothetical protein